MNDDRIVLVVILNTARDIMRCLVASLAMSASNENLDSIQAVHNALASCRIGVGVETLFVHHRPPFMFE